MLQRLACLLCVLLLPCLGGGCESDSSSSGDTIAKPDNTYKGLSGQMCAIMVGADYRTRNEYNTIQLDLARMLQQQLTGTGEKDAKDAKDSKDSKDSKKPGLQFINPASVVRYQREHPKVETMSAVEVAPLLGVSRLIYIDLEDFSAQSPDAIMVLKGTAKATLRVVEVAGGKGTATFQESGIEVHYPPDAPEGVVESDKYNARTVYLGTLQRLSEFLAVRFEDR